ncbi:MAG: hypothetical protein BWK76_28440 [Desulfobulbaceae bacterium A2]|nr:MAG: hypothetical protein BWK76_28440 [Desulfobulbaceae bacterium A2]
MDVLGKKLFHELEMMRRESGRVFRHLAFGRLHPFEGGSSWRPAADIYETATEVLAYLDVAGVDPASLSVVAEEGGLRVSGRRELPPQPELVCVHQLELEFGPFERVLPLPPAVDVANISSRYQQGLLVIVMPKRRQQDKIRIQVLS